MHILGKHHTAPPICNVNSHLTTTLLTTVVKRRETKGKHFPSSQNNKLKHRLCLIKSLFLPPLPLPLHTVFIELLSTDRPTNPFDITSQYLCIGLIQTGYSSFRVNNDIRFNINNNNIIPPPLGSGTHFRPS